MPRNVYDPLIFSRKNDEEDPVIPVVEPGPEVDPAAVNPQDYLAQQAVAQADPHKIPEFRQCPHCAEADKARLLALADAENTRKRLAREKEEFRRYAGESVISDILPALDNLDLALAYAPDAKECRNFVVGVDMTRKLLLDALSRHGLEQVGELGEQFDPANHEAVGLEPHAEYANGQICGLMNKGYKLKDRLLRPARVMVCKNEE